MGTPRQIESARINGQKSRGPITSEGKRRSSTNARKHGLAAKHFAPNPESASRFEEILDGYRNALQPATPLELDLVRRMAFAQVRGLEAGAVETGIWNNALAANNNSVASAFRALSANNELATILRYQIRYRRQYFLALDLFLEARNTNLPNEPDSTSASTEQKQSILPNEPDSAPATPQKESILPNEPESQHPIVPRTRCTHSAWLSQTHQTHRIVPQPTGDHAHPPRM